MSAVFIVGNTLQKTRAQRSKTNGKAAHAHYVSRMRFLHLKKRKTRGSGMGWKNFLFYI